MASMAKTPKKPGKKAAKPPTVAKTWAERLKQLRIDRDITQVEAAKLVGVPVRTWLSWEYAHREPSSANIRFLLITFPELA